mmetsp:Transcript_12481/g.26416  ORF Transcript_12481/g.26416 Transcript_12481/m.26416 type:complete len:158 (-) Transcript_12481:156-629(-)
MSDQTHGATMDQAKRRIRWTRERDIALLAQVIAMGVRTFVTSKANTRDMKEEEKFNQGEAWTNTTDGILTMLGKHEAFSGIEMPGYQSVINHITGADGVDDSHQHRHDGARTGRLRRLPRPVRPRRCPGLPNCSHGAPQCRHESEFSQGALVALCCL